jgi:pimeloyl-ACP methyl ester carboxylesterase
MITFLLIHGMWHGGWCWERLMPLLRAAGHVVYAPTLAGLGERAQLKNNDIDLNTHIQEIVNVCEVNDLWEVILVGHSLSGFMAPVVADRIPERIAHIVNLDGIIPEYGKAFKDMMPDYWIDFKNRALTSGNEWWAPPVLEWTFGVSGADLEWMQSKLTPHPLKTWTTVVNLSNPAAQSLPRTFILCTDGYSEDEIEQEKTKFTQAGYSYRSLPTGHDAMITMPNALANILLELAKEDQ